MRVGIFGGSFDPVHLGHLLLGEFCREQAGLDEVWFVPANRAPHKTDGPRASAKHRLEMLRLATWGHEQFRVSDLEIRRSGVSFTVESLESLKQTNPTDALFFLMGADSLNEFSTWRDPRRICELATPLVVVRGGGEEPRWDVLHDFVNPSQSASLKSHRVDFPAIDLSSSEIRRRLDQGLSIRYQTPRAVEQYIRTHQLYCLEGQSDIKEGDVAN